MRVLILITELGLRCSALVVVMAAAAAVYEGEKNRKCCEPPKKIGDHYRKGEW